MQEPRGGLKTAVRCVTPVVLVWDLPRLIPGYILVSLTHTHLPCLVIVLHLAQIPAAGLSDPLPRHQIPNHHGGGADF